MIIQVVRGVKGQKMTQNDQKLCFLCLISEEPYITWSSFMVHMCKRIIFLGLFVHFFQIFNFGVNCVVKGQKMVQNDKNFCLLHSIFQEAYIIWLWFLVRICKMMISVAIFFSFSKLWFSRFLRWCKRTKNHL